MSRSATEVKLTLALAASALALLTSGCAALRLPDKPPGGPVAATRQAGDVLAETEAALNRSTPTSPVATVLDLWHQMQIARPQSALNDYEPGVRTSLGDETIGRGLKAQSSLFDLYLPRISTSRRTRAGVVVVVSAQPGSGAPLQIDYVLRHQTGRWYIAYDTALAAGLSSYGHEKASPFNRVVRPGSAPASAAGAALEARYRSLTPSSAALGLTNGA